MVAAVDLAKLIEHSRVSFGSSLRHHIFGKDLACEWRWLERKRLGLREHFAVNRRGRNLTFLDRKQGLARFPVEQENEAGLGDLCHGVDKAAVPFHLEQTGRRGQVAVPDVMLDGLKMPDALTCFGFQRKQRVGEKVVAGAVGSVKVERR